MAKNMDTSGDVGTGGGQQYGVMKLNNLIYALEPDLSVAVNKTHKKHFFQANEYRDNQSSICILNSGAEYIDTRRSYLSFNIEITQESDVTALNEVGGYFGTQGSACNLIDTITVSTRSGDEISRITDYPLLMNMLCPMTFEKDWDKKGNERLEVRYYDVDGEFLNEYFYFNSYSKRQAFYHNFVRSHIKNAGPTFDVQSLEQVYLCQMLFAKPKFVIARLVHKFWKVREKVFEW